MTQHSYEQAAADNWPKDQLPPDDGRYCPPFEGTLFRLAEAKHRGTPLTPELKNVQEHTETCSSCRSTVTGVLSFYTAESNTDGNSRNAIDDNSWKGTPLRRLREAAKALKSVSGTPREVLICLAQGAGLTNAEAFRTIGYPANRQDFIDDEEGLELLRMLGVEERLVMTIAVRSVPRVPQPADATAVRVLAPKNAGHDE